MSAQNKKIEYEGVWPHKRHPKLHTEGLDLQRCLFASIENNDGDNCVLFIPT